MPVSAGAQLDLFVLFSSMSGIIGQPGQANYASAVDGIGYMSQTSGLMQKMDGAWFKPAKKEELLDALMVAMQPQQPQEDEPHKTEARFTELDTFVLGLSSQYHSMTPQTGHYGSETVAWQSTTTPVFSRPQSQQPHLPSKATSPMPEPSRRFSRAKRRLLLKPDQELNTEMTLVDLGVDSLLGIELRQWRQVFGFDISVLEMLGTGTLDALGKFAAKGLAKEFNR
ncbi:hypothetical protein HYALB_00013286 [Hymenoscyphus albidus]|uniref:Polyketide synthase-like phosphopantetheine-binding domain-containing protein n=1 Tax=Hymenoscyphus albidus TaxID=595503 RepID=A0A9N9LWJ4_9HELO|nr:hypothetical protein HYALB_00013286 [Hymenoscyphus albidus]